MTKTQKQRDKHIRLALTNACEAIKESVIGFDYLTHTIDLNNEANTLKVQCYFIDEVAREDAKPQLDELTQIILSQLAAIKLNAKPAHISFLAN
ncbi:MULTISPECIES: hypothetical protein [Pseudoalteromonas]|jgi:hypothetical protein|uniref:hypothetical protein n=1 Tax=Pseudoalteromonas TaxID=53246 RepID=UPI0013FDFC9F|nr:MULTISPECIES: hypothetical protein [Pseudoalteromonas]MBB1347656.1 hypothetical protein [Pseudoalteromonas sp. SG45-2]|tara:strand:- start:452 stop:733 length:282 start_codon:yes stop_codon:yes gene_type:complete